VVATVGDTAIAPGRLTAPTSESASVPSPGTAPFGARGPGCASSAPSSRRYLPVLILGAVALVAVIVLVVVLTGSKHTTVVVTPTAPTGTSRPDPSPPPTPAASPLTADSEAQSLSALVAASAGQRSSVSGAATDLEGCGNPTADETAFTSAASARQSVVNQLGTLPVSLIPNGGQMVQDLTSALNYSIQSDNSYAKWAADEVSNCSTDYQADPNFAAAQQTDPLANSAKAAFTQLWNATAPQYGLGTWDPTKI